MERDIAEDARREADRERRDLHAVATDRAHSRTKRVGERTQRLRPAHEDPPSRRRSVDPPERRDDTLGPDPRIVVAPPDTARDGGPPEREPARRETFWAGARQNALFLGKWLGPAFVLESLMVAYVPGDLISGIAGDGGFLSILIATFVGIPSYLNGNAALPLVAGLMDKGMAPGAAMAFLVGGGVTSIPAALAVWAIARRQVFAAYIAFAAVGALLSGLAFQIVAG